MTADQTVRRIGRRLKRARREGAAAVDSVRAGATARWKRLRRKYRVEVNTVYTRPLDQDPPSVEGYRLVPADEENLARLRATYPKEVDERKYQILRHRVVDPAEDAWVIVDADGTECGFACLAWQDHEIKMMKHTVRVRPHQALFMDDYVVRRRRRRGAQTASIALRVPIAAERGRTEGLVFVDVQNAGSTSAYRKVGFRPVGRLVHVRGIRRTVEWRRPRAASRR